MFRLLLIIAVVAIGYDAVIHHGAYTRNAWDSVVGITGSAVDSAKQLGDRVKDDTPARTN